MALDSRRLSRAIPHLNRMCYRLNMLYLVLQSGI